MKSYARYSTPVVLNETMWGLGTSLYPTIMGYMAGSTEILAGYAISGNIEKVCTVVVFAIAGTAAIIVGREIGAGRASTVYDTGKCLNTLAFLTGLAVGAAGTALGPGERCVLAIRGRFCCIFARSQIIYILTIDIARGWW